MNHLEWIPQKLNFPEMLFLFENGHYEKKNQILLINDILKYLKNVPIRPFRITDGTGVILFSWIIDKTEKSFQIDAFKPIR